MARSITAVNTVQANLYDGDTTTSDPGALDVRLPTPPEHDELLDEDPVGGAPHVQAHFGQVFGRNLDGLGVLLGATAGTHRGLPRKEWSVEVVFLGGLAANGKRGVGAVFRLVVFVRLFIVVGKEVVIVLVVREVATVVAGDHVGQGDEDLCGEATEVRDQSDLRGLLRGLVGLDASTADGA